MANEFKLQVRNSEEYEIYTVEQLMETVEHFNQMINEIRMERTVVEKVLRMKQSVQDMTNKVSAMSETERDALRQVLALDGVPSAVVVNA